VTCTAFALHGGHIIHLLTTILGGQLILVWTPGKASPIHDHANAHCVMRILKGSLTETIYGWPCEGADGLTDCATSPTHPTGHTCSAEPEQLEPHALCVKRSTCYGRGQVTYMSDRLGLHRIQNASTEEVAVSLHLYTVRSATTSPRFLEIEILTCACIATERRQARLSHLRPEDGQEVQGAAVPLLL